jgi:alkanesulfonate monooxygenase SsuD/methylene tetrahydromethanopterin reductase-like flavin-dependent oxidoreductase (luciferase family)
VVVAGTVAVAATEEEAARLLMPEAWALAYSRTRGVFPPLEPPERIESRSMTDRQREFYASGLRGHIHGTEEQVRDALERAVAETTADEVLVTTSTYDRAALLDSYARLARVAGLTRADT